MKGQSKRQKKSEEQISHRLKSFRDDKIKRRDADLKVRST
jgi:hypothetical protein